MRGSRRVRSLVCAAGAFMAAPVMAADNFTVVVDGLNATSGKAISALGYKPDLDGAGPDLETVYVGSFGYTGTGTNAAIRAITGVNLGETKVSTPLIAESYLRYYYGDGSTNASISGATGPGAIMLNPLPIGTGPSAIPAYSAGWLSDAVSVDSTPSKSDRLSRYTLNPVTSNAQAVSEITNLVNLDDFLTISGGTSTNSSRRGAWSSDGQFIYHSDSVSTQSGGIYRTNALTGQIQRILTGADASTATEVAVLPQPGGVDRVLYMGKSGAANAGGINYIDYAGMPNPTPQVFLAESKLADFLDGATVDRNALAEPHSITTTANGDVYFMDDSYDTLVKMDSQGRLIKVHSRDERIAAGLTTHSSNLDLITRQAPTPGGFSVTQVMFVESSSNNVIGAYDYLPGDFNRNNAVDATDRSDFLAALKPRLAYDANAATPAPALTAVSKFDLNGNHTVDWKDIKILQQFLAFENGDTNLDGFVNFTDLNTLRDNYYTLGGAADKTWLLGDLASLDPASLMYLPSAADANLVNLVDLQVLADTWLDVLGQPNLTEADLNAYGYTGQFRSDVISAFGVVPEPTTLTLLVPAGLALLARRRAR